MTTAKQEKDIPVTVPDNSQHWAGMDGAIAWHLIERHADSWADVGKMMREWLEANQQAATLAERERCALACEVIASDFGGVAEGPFVTDFGKHTHQAMAAGAQNCAASIRGEE